MGVTVNPEFIGAFTNLKTEKFAYENILKQYGEGSKEANAVAAKLRAAESIFSNQKALVEDKNSNMTKEEALTKVDSYMNQVSSWYVRS